eukprot:5345588-Pyramimonas_sp.AAC.1
MENSSLPPDAGFTPPDADFIPLGADFTPLNAKFTPPDPDFTPPDDAGGRHAAHRVLTVLPGSVQSVQAGVPRQGGAVPGHHLRRPGHQGEPLASWALSIMEPLASWA